MDDPLKTAVLFSTVLLVFYFIYTLKTHPKKPDLAEAIKLLVASNGIILSINLGYLTLFERDLFSGKLEGQRIIIIIGVLATLWLSVNAIGEIYTQHIQTQKPPVRS